MRFNKTFAVQSLVALSLLASGNIASPAKSGANCPPGCATSESEVPMVKRETLKSELDSVKLVDALDQSCFDRSHVKGSVNIPMGSEAKLAPELLPDKDAKIVVYCMNTQCHASDGVAKQLSSMGYKNVSIYRAGLVDLVSHNFPLEGSSPKSPMPIEAASK